jgi:hypothetical protein
MAKQSAYARREKVRRRNERGSDRATAAAWKVVARLQRDLGRLLDANERRHQSLEPGVRELFIDPQLRKIAEARHLLAIARTAR